MIQAAILKDFQRHKLLKLEFSPALTAVVGSNDLGKSSIRRALSWTLLDYPKGKGVINKDADQTTVLIKTDKDIVQRLRSKNGDINTWKFNSQEFVKPGAIPEPIAELTKHGVVELDQTSLNLCFTRQNDGYFLIDEGPTFRARLIDDLTGVFVAEKAIRLGKLEVKELEGQKQIAVDAITEAQQEADKRKRFIILAKKADIFQQEIEKIETANQSLIDLQSLLTKIETKRKQAQSIRLLPKLPSYIEIKSSLQKLKAVNYLLLKIDKLKTRQKEIKLIEPPKLDATQTISNILKLKLIASKLSKIAICRNSLTNVKKELQINTQELEVARNQFKEFDRFKCEKCGQLLRK